ncbi:hypothetical protein LCGC14_2550570 [marine sediment metagenome]|uniref:Uncharacterized protein n=1 Tax=marine sediment metagenome TaxID=412755 RepID=A0A0F9CZB8_9ZZZZ
MSIGEENMGNSEKGAVREKLSIEHRLTKLEVSLSEVVRNHLPHIEKKLNWVLAMLVTFLLSTIGTLIALLR